MKLRIYCNDSEIPMQVIDVTKVERVMPDGSIRQMKAAVEPLQFTHDPADDWTYIDPADPTTLPENSQKVLATVRLLRALNKDDDLDVMPAYAADGFWYTYDRKLLAKPDYEVIAWQPWPEPAPIEPKEG